jgi:hypothetical protein
VVEFGLEVELVGEGGVGWGAGDLEESFLGGGGGLEGGEGGWFERRG